ncbi:hypothetical protein [Pseudoxanthomonas sp. SE1]|uniref:hypothetical protein n=1 Tax=Pseudoxanthomonas sp. SE1 TaxID=1664560 RepID=UPI00240D4C9A|nr:hypothetical protein [Pseudoxanthomonas sp. SE1]WFC43269.1 hypothetical protein OY559_07085 [Pseudoxanthomonas sp. SE1]
MERLLWRHPLTTFTEASGPPHSDLGTLVPNPGMVPAMDRDPPNPYRDMTLRELHQVMNERAGELLKGANVSRRDLAYLLLAAAFPLATGENRPGSPAHRVRQGADIADAFWPELQQDFRAVMHLTFEHAREAAQLTWEDLHRYGETLLAQGAPSYWGTETEEDLRRSLQQLQAAKALKANLWRAP